MNAWHWDGITFQPVTALPVSDRALRYGMALFETIRIHRGVAEFLTEHEQRLNTACAELGFPLPPAAALAALPTLLAKVGDDGVARIYFTGGDGSPASPVEKPRLLVMFEARAPEPEAAWDVCFHDEPYRPVFAGLKTANYWANCTAIAAARARHFHEALLFNDYAELVSACCANVFIVKEDRILTPSGASACRLGVIREWVCQRRKVEERRLRREDVLQAEEIFLTNSWIGIQPIATLEGRPLGPRRIALQLAGELEHRRLQGSDAPPRV